MQNNLHVINRQVFEFTCFEQEHAFQLQSKLNNDLKQVLINQIEKACDEWNDSSNIEVIPRLEIDLGIISFTQLEQLLPGKFSTVFKESLLQHLVKRRLQEKNGISIQQNTINLIEYFLLHGSLPWWVKKNSEYNFSELIQEAIYLFPELVKKMIARNNKREVFFQRLVAQIEFKVLQELLTLIDFGKELSPDNPVSIKNVSLSGLLIKIEKLLVDVSEALSGQVLFSSDEAATRLLVRLIPVGGKNESTDQVRQLIIREIQFYFPSLTHAELDRVVNANLLENFRTVLNEINQSFDNNEIADANMHNEPSNNDDDSKVLIHNAGIVLLSVFLPALFKELHLYNNDQFVSKEHQQKALFILHYLCTGQLKTPEYTLQLSKILCGMNLEETVPSVIDLSEREIIECAQLINEAIGHWGAIKNTSIEGLRDSFLQREGLLSFKNNHWLLQIERSGFDLLLDSLPWSFQTIKFSWMETYIEVEW